MPICVACAQGSGAEKSGFVRFVLFRHLALTVFKAEGPQRPLRRHIGNYDCVQPQVFIVTNSSAAVG
jgi:hypothetical protein